MTRALSGTTRVVPDKSVTHRGVLLAAVTEGRTELKNPNPGADCRATFGAARALGAGTAELPECWSIDGGLDRLDEPTDVIDLGNSGTGIRLLGGLLAGLPLFAVLTGDRSLRKRPMNRIIEPLRRLGAEIAARKGGFAPLCIRGTERGLAIEGGRSDVRLAVASAQVKSAVLLAQLFRSEGVAAVREPGASRDHTERLLRYLGADVVEVEGSGIELRLPARLRARSFTVPGDFSAAAFLLVAGAIVPGSRVRIEGVGLNPTRTGALDVLRRMGAEVRMIPEEVDGPEPVGTLEVASGPLVATDVGGAEVPRLIDEIPILALAAARARGTSRFHGAAELRVKESDRITTTCRMLHALGAKVEEHPDGFTVHGVNRWNDATIETEDDHRIAMSALVAGCVGDGEIRPDTEHMIETSDPGFLARLKALRGEAP